MSNGKEVVWRSRGREGQWRGESEPKASAYDDSAVAVKVASNVGLQVADEVAAQIATETAEELTVRFRRRIAAQATLTMPSGTGS